MQSEIRVRSRASGSVFGAGDVPVPAYPAERVLRVAEDTAEPAVAGRQASDQSRLRDERKVGRYFLFAMFIPSAANFASLAQILGVNAIAEELIRDPQLVSLLVD